MEESESAYQDMPKYDLKTHNEQLRLEYVAPDTWGLEQTHSAAGKVDRQVYSFERWGPFDTIEKKCN